MLKYHTPLKGSAKTHSFLAFDVEGIGGPGGFWCGATYSDQGGKTYLARDQMWADLVSADAPTVWRVAHNLEYDLSVVALEALLDSGSVMGEGGLLWYDYPSPSGDTIRFIDSLNLFREHSVAELGLMVDLPKLELPAGFLDVLRYGYPLDYFSESEKALLFEYNLRDAEIVYRAMCFLQNMVNELGGELRETIAATSHDLYRRVFMPHPWPIIGPKTNEAARQAFYGGRVEPYRMQESHDVNIYDVNSLYPYIMANEKFPHPGSLDIDTPGKLPADLERREGVISCRVSVPDVYCPPLPARLANSLFFPVGTWEGTFTINELRHALECGVEVKRVDWMISTSRTFNPFVDFVTELWKRRMELKITNPAGEKVVKMLLNAHIGRYGVRAEPPLTTLEIVRDRFDPERDQGLMWDTIGRFDYIERPIGDGHHPTYANVFFAAQVSSGARVLLHREMLKQDHHMVYCDTDSIMTRGEIPVGAGLGEWKCLLERGVVDLISPKEYTVMIDHYLALYKAKGVPNKVAVEYLINGVARYQKALSIRQARIGNRWPGSWVEVYQQRGSPVPKRSPVAVRKDYHGPVKTQPWSHAEIAQEVATPSRSLSWRE